MKFRYRCLPHFGFGLAAAFGLSLAVPFGPVAAEGDTALPPPYNSVAIGTVVPEPDALLPDVLNERDAANYQRIFEIQENGKWKQADKLAKRIGDKVLMGHVLAQRYLHPTKYRSRYKELKIWLDQYNDHPDAKRIYDLAMRRKPANWRSPKRPAKTGRAAASASRARLTIPSRRLSVSGRSKVRAYKRHIRSSLRRGHTLVVKRMLASKEVQQLFSTPEYDKVRAQLGQGYFRDGRDEWALQWAGKAAQRSGKYMPEAHWIAGLAAWRLGRKELAAEHFSGAAQLSSQDSWFHAAAAFWAARAYLVTRQPEKVTALLQQAADHRRSFYGILAARLLGQPMNFRWRMPPLKGHVVESLTTSKRGRRALALAQVGEGLRAERELRALARGADKTLAHGILAVAARTNMAGLAVRLNQQLYPQGGGFDGAAYPVPRWTPADGFRVDRALIYALIRQESKFNPKAKSWAGARGLMQLMPGTARFVARRGGDKRFKRRKLYTPEVNLELGQRYIEMLLKNTKIKGDLFLMAAAWNGGPGNLNKWRRKTDDLDDPLFFIESIPSRETRIFIERVLANLWIYRDQLRQPTPSLDAIAAGQWPVYTPLGQHPVEVAETHGARKSN